MQRAGDKEIRAWTIKPARTESIKHTFMSVLDIGQLDFKAPVQVSRNFLRQKLRDESLNFRIALASICRILSRFTSNSCPISSRVLVPFPPIPYRILRIFASLGSSVKSDLSASLLRSFLNTGALATLFSESGSGCLHGTYERNQTYLCQTDDICGQC